MGRRDEIAAVSALLTASADTSVGIVIEGEPGIGKTTVWLHGLHLARANGFRVLAARGAPAESVLAYAALADLLADVDPALWADLPAPQRHGLAAALLREPDTGIAVVDQRAVGAALLTLVDRLSAKSPVVLAIDDLQWIDASSIAAIRFAVRRLTSGVAVACTLRSGAGAADARIELAAPDALTRIHLQPLTAGELQDVLAAQPMGRVSRSRVLRIHQLSGGNPFYALELAREADQHGDSTDLVLPDSLTELTHARIGRVEQGAEDALLAIASLATPTLPVVAAAIGVTPQRAIAMLELAEAHSVVAIDGSRVQFTHPLLAHAVASAVPPAHRRAMHRRLAGVVTAPEVRARHLALADPTGEPATLAALDDAANIARARGAPAAAAELLELAIRLGDGSAPRRIRLAQCLFASGDLREARRVLEAVVAELTPGPTRGEALALLMLVRLHDDSFLEAAELGRRALADSPSASTLRVHLLTAVAFAQLNTGQVESAFSTAEQAVATARLLSQQEPLGRALGMRAMMQFMIGDGFAATDLQQALALAGPESDMALAFRPSIQNALLMGWTGHLQSARDALYRAEQNCVARGEEGELMFIAFQRTVFDIWSAELDRAAETADEALHRARLIGGDASTFIASSLQAAVAAYQGRIDDARTHIEEAMAAGQGSGYVFMLSWTVAIHGFLELSLGNHAQALAVLSPLMPMVELMPRCTEVLTTGFLPDAIEAMIILGRLDEAETRIAVLERNGHRLDRPWALAVGARCRAMLLAARGEVGAAATSARHALTQHDRVPMPVERGRTLLLLGKLERRLRHPGAAAAALGEALSIFENAGMPLWISQVRTELDRVARRGVHPFGLTPTEQRIADLAAGGMNNRDIASTLFITRKTVEVNLTRIYRKLGIHSRSELYHVIAVDP
ncbi:helix-turn-helix transcriptional regulator [Mycolicibacterium helvum]|uniref:helix-turn-helix transcriptional regulator n=1 Tax=Mycolicibacterium helvum TaxID=1534349 RepID=UPI0013D6660B|nr:LuxR family transcriptional regulator [Mycolicibacterium helvum]